MYIVTDVPLAWALIEWSRLDESGATKTHAIRMKVELVDLDRIESFLRVFASQALPGDIGPLDFLISVSRDWDEIVTEDGRPFPFTPENLMTIAKSPGFLPGFQMSYTKAWHGQTKEREKNLPGSPADGPVAPNPKARRARQSSSKQ